MDLVTPSPVTPVAATPAKGTDAVSAPELSSADAAKLPETKSFSETMADQQATVAEPSKKPIKILSVGTSVLPVSVETPVIDIGEGNVLPVAGQAATFLAASMVDSDAEGTDDTVIELDAAQGEVSLDPTASQVVVPAGIDASWHWQVRPMSASATSDSLKAEPTLLAAFNPGNADRGKGVEASATSAAKSSAADADRKAVPITNADNRLSQLSATMAAKWQLEPTMKAAVQSSVGSQDGGAIAPATSVAVPAQAQLSNPIDNAATSWQTQIGVEVGKPGWGDAVTQRVMWMSSQQLGKAEIALDPPELGPLQVRISQHHDQTTVVFSSQHAAVRDALDQGLSRLKEMLEGQGLNQVSVDVSGGGSERQFNFGENPQFADRDASPLASGQADRPVGDSGVADVAIRQSVGLVDHYV